MNVTKHQVWETELTTRHDRGTVGSYCLVKQSLSFEISVQIENEVTNKLPSCKRSTTTFSTVYINFMYLGEHNQSSDDTET